MSTHTLYKGAAIVVSLVVAGFAVTNWADGAFNQVFPNEKVYKQLAQLAAGMSVETFDAALGPPAIERPQTATQSKGTELAAQDFTLRVYMKDQFVVTTLATADDSTVLYSVLACNPQFEPYFVTPLESTVRLQRAPLSEADVPRARKSTLFTPTPSQVPAPTVTVEPTDFPYNRQEPDTSVQRAPATPVPSPTGTLTVVPQAQAPTDLSSVLFFGGSTGRSPAIYVEIPISVPDGTTNERTYGFGVNEACGDLTITTAGGYPVSSFNIPVEEWQPQPTYSEDEAAAAVVRYRESTPANFYFETAANFTPPSSYAMNPGLDASGLLNEMFSIVSPTDEEFPARYAVEQMGQ